MASDNYQYETSPKKILPEYNHKKEKQKETNKNNKSKKINKKEIEQKNKELKQQKRMHHKNIVIILGIFLVFLAVSYRNSLINEKFNEIQKKKSELAFVEKTNGQLEVGIEGSLNLNNVEKSAKDKLGMQKLQNEQKVYVALPKQDYTESATKEITEEKESNWIKDFINSIFKW